MQETQDSRPHPVWQGVKTALATAARYVGGTGLCAGALTLLGSAVWESGAHTDVKSAAKACVAAHDEKDSVFSHFFGFSAGQAPACDYAAEQGLILSNRIRTLQTGTLAVMFGAAALYSLGRRRAESPAPVSRHAYDDFVY